MAGGIAIDYHTVLNMSRQVFFGARRINVGDVRHRLVANFDPVSPATNLPLAALQGRGEDAAGRF